MKLLLVLACLVASALAKDLRSSETSDEPQPEFMQQIRNQGYIPNTYTVQTDDGYILRLMRIRNSEQPNRSKPVVLLMHGMLGSALDWTYGGSSQGLSYQLADQGVDVFLGNARGSKYGMQHTTLNSNRDLAFWQFSWDDIGTKDLPAIIKKTLEITGRRKLKIVGHMAGATAAFIMASEVPEARRNVSQMVALGPIAFMDKATQPFLTAVEPNRSSNIWVLKNLGQAALTPSTELITQVQSQCINKRNIYCNNLYFLLNGFNSDQMNQTTVSKIQPNNPNGGTVRQILHMAQMKASGNFEKYQSDSSAEPQQYDLSKVTFPTVVLFAPNDTLSNRVNVKTLVQKLPEVFWAMVPTVTNNMDLLYADNVAWFNRKVIWLLTRSSDEIADTSFFKK